MFMLTMLVAQMSNIQGMPKRLKALSALCFLYVAGSALAALHR